MYIPTREELQKILDKPLFHKISETADELGMECYIVGGYVRDIFLERPSTDIDVVVVGKGIEMARAFSKRLGRGAHLSVYANFGTAQVKYGYSAEHQKHILRFTPGIENQAEQQQDCIFQDPGGKKIAEHYCRQEVI